MNFVFVLLSLTLTSAQAQVPTEEETTGAIMVDSPGMPISEDPAAGDGPIGKKQAAANARRLWMSGWGVEYQRKTPMDSEPLEDLGHRVRVTIEPGDSTLKLSGTWDFSEGRISQADAVLTPKFASITPNFFGDSVVGRALTPFLRDWITTVLSYHRDVDGGVDHEFEAVRITAPFYVAGGGVDDAVFVGITVGSAIAHRWFTEGEKGWLVDSAAGLAVGVELYERLLLTVFGNASRAFMLTGDQGNYNKLAAGMQVTGGLDEDRATRIYTNFSYHYDGNNENTQREVHAGFLHFGVEWGGSQSSADHGWQWRER